MKKIFYISCILFTVVSAVLTVFTVSGNAETGMLLMREAELSERQDDLKRGLVASHSIEELDVKAEELGFTSPTELLYVNDIAVVAGLTR